MAWHWIIQNYLRGLAEQKIRETVAQAAREQMAAAAGPEAAQARPCDLGVVFALASESGGLEDLLTGLVTIKGEGFVLRQGEWEGRRVAIVLSGAGRQAAARAAEALLLGHRPNWIVSAGFCGALSAKLNRHDLLVADRVADVQGSEIALDLTPIRDAPFLAKPGMHVGRLLSVDRIVRRPREKKALGQAHDALGVDLETLAVVDVARRRGVPVLAVRVVSDAVDDQLPREVERLSRQKSRTAQFGAALGAILNRPGAFKEMYQLRENALAASDRLAKVLVRLIEHLVPPPQQAQEPQQGG